MFSRLAMATWRRIRRKMKSLQGIPLKYSTKLILDRRWDNRHFHVANHHALNGMLIINLTSYPPRFATLRLTIQSLLLQEVGADKLVLWLYRPDFELLPAEVLDLQSEGLTIELIEEDIKSYKKLVPALEKWPDAYHVTADDDIYYRKDWLRDLLSGYEAGQANVVCLRAHYVTLDEYGNLNPYKKWIAKTEEKGPSNRLFFTSGAGVLIAPGSLFRDVTVADKFMRLSPYADDVWFNWMAALNGSAIRRVGHNHKVVVWKGTKSQSLWQVNKDPARGNDFQIGNMVKEYGNPFKPE